MLIIGCHLSTAGGFRAMGRTAAEIGASTFQFFTRNPRGGAAKAIDPVDVAEFLELAAEHGISRVLGHAPYTLNACSDKERVREFARETLIGDIRRMEHIPDSLYNLHPGSHVGQGVEKGIEIIADALNNAITSEQSTTVLLETMAGKGSEIGGRFEELREIIDRTENHEKLGICLDTCHIYDAGYDIVHDLDGVLTELDRVVGLDRLYAVHLNDSKNPFGSKRDRHETIGGGTLGLDTFKAVINHPALRELPFYLETPNELPGYADEIKLLRELYAG